MKKYSYFGKRVLSMTIAMAMCASMLQVSALAVDEGEENTDDKLTYTTMDNTEITVDKRKDGIDDNKANTTHVEGSYTDAGEHKEVTVDVTENPSQKIESNPIDDVVVTGDRETISDTSKVTESDEEGRPTKVEGEKSESQVTETTKIESSTESQLTTETKVELGDRDNGKVTHTTGDKITHETSDKTKYETVKDDLKVEISVEPGKKKSDEDSLNVKEIVEELKPDVSDFTETKPGVWVREFDDKDGTKIHTQVETSYDADGNVIGYKTTTTTTTTQEGDYSLVKDTTVGQIDSNPDVTHEDSTTDPQKVDFDGTPSTTVEEGIVPEGATPILDDNGKTIGYTVVTPIETKDEDGNVISTETRTENVYFKTTTEQVTDKTQEIKKEVTTTVEKVEGKITEQRKDTTNTKTDVKEQVLDASSDKLTVELSMDAISDNTTYDDSADNKRDWYYDEDFQEDAGNVAKDYFDNEVIKVDCFTGTNVTVQQKECDSNGYAAEMEIKLNFSKSQFDSSLLRLNVTKMGVDKEGNPTRVTETYKLSDGEGHKFIDYDERTGNAIFRLQNIDSDTIELQLTGKQWMESTSDDGQKIIRAEKDLNMSTSIRVQITEAKAEIKTDHNFTETERKDTLTFERDKTVTNTKREENTTTIDKTVIQSTDRWETKWDSTYTYNDDDDDDDNGDEGGDTGDTGDTTPTTTLPDADVPLAETPTIDLPDAEVPLADAANALTDDTAALSDDVAVDIADDIVPLAAVPEELAEIAGVEVPLADVPQTGDASPMWFVTLLLSGLALLGLRKKEEI